MSSSPVVAIVQCRLRSSRLPGKALMPIVEDMSILEFLLRRLQRCKRLDDLVLTTGADPANDPIASVAAKLGVKCARGSEDDVLSRFVAAADQTGAQTIVRVCADNPLTDPFLIDEMIERFQASPETDHLASFAEPSVPYGVGCAIFSRETLNLTDKSCPPDDPSREHVEPFMLETETISTSHFTAEPARHLPELKVTIDRPRDYDFVQPIAAALYRRFGFDFGTKELAQMVSRPQLALFANGRLGLDGAKFFAETGAEITALILHPEGSASCRDDIRAVLGGKVEHVIDYKQIKDLGVGWFEERGADIGMSLWSSYIFKKEVIERMPLGIYNLHNSLLPALGGSGANIWSILLEVQSGATLHRVTADIDRGPIIDQRPLPVTWSETGGSLFDKQHALMMQLLKERWSDLPLGRYDYIEPTAEPSYFRKAQRDDAKIIDLEKQYTGRELLNIIRAYQFGNEDAAFFVDETGVSWDARISLTKRLRDKDDKA